MAAAGDRCKTAAMAAAAAAAPAAEEDYSVVLRCVDLARFTVPASLALRSGLVARAVASGEHAVDLPREVSSKGVATVVAYWEGRAAAAARGEDLAGFDWEFVRTLSRAGNHDALIDLIHAAAPDHLDDEGLFSLFLA